MRRQHWRQEGDDNDQQGDGGGDHRRGGRLEAPPDVAVGGAREPLGHQCPPARARPRARRRTLMAEWLARAADSDIWWSFKSSATTVIAAAVTLLIVVIAFLSPVLAPHTPFDPSTLSLS